MRCGDQEKSGQNQGADRWKRANQTGGAGRECRGWIYLYCCRVKLEDSSCVDVKTYVLRKAIWYKEMIKVFREFLTFEKSWNFSKVWFRLKRTEWRLNGKKESTRLKKSGRQESTRWTFIIFLQIFWKNRYKRTAEKDISLKLRITETYLFF